MRIHLSRRARGNLLVLLGTVFLCLAGAELALRVIGYSNPIYHRPDVDRGWAPWEGLDASFGTDGKASLRYNEDGIRGPAVARIAPEGTFRVAVVGDSFTEAQEIAYEETFVAGIEAELESCPLLQGRRPQTLNFGVGGYGTHQQLIDYRLRVRDFAPDLVLLVVFPGNDVSNNSPNLDGNKKRPYFSLEGDELRPPAARDSSSVFWRSLKARAYNSLRVAQLFEQTRRAIKYGLLKAPTAQVARDGAPDKDDWVMAPPRDEAWRGAWRLTTALLTALKQDVEADGSAFAAALISVPIQVHPDAGLRERFLATLEIEDLFHPNRRLSQWAEQQQAILIDPLHELQAEVARTGVYIHGFENNLLGYGHYNRDGHAHFARVVGQALCRHPSLFGTASEAD